MSITASPRSVMLTRSLAVTITFGVGAASFALSFTALRDLATRGHVPAGQAWLWPLMVDGAILLATLGVVVMAGDTQCRNDRRFFWMVLCGGAVVSITCNALHAILPADQPLNAWLRGFLAGVAPAALLVTTHGLTLLTQMQRRSATITPATMDDETSGSADAAAGTVDEQSTAVSAKLAPAGPPAADMNRMPTDAGSEDRQLQIPADSRWHAMAPRVMERVSLKDTGHNDVAQVLYLSYERTMTNREIGRRLDMSHHTVGKIQTAGAHVLREEQEAAVPVPS